MWTDSAACPGIRPRTIRTWRSSTPGSDHAATPFAAATSKSSDQVVARRELDDHGANVLVAAGESSA